MDVLILVASPFIQQLSIFALAIFVGYYVVWSANACLGRAVPWADSKYA